MTPRDILHFWFEEATPKQWFVQDAAFDALISQRFSEVYARARRGDLDSWSVTAEGAAALVIILDQFPRNMFRGSGQSFATDAKALSVARDAIARGLDKQLTTSQRKFLYMPFMHGESLAVQDEGVAIFEQLNDPDTMKWVVQHRDAIVRFGRFPGRNAALSRTSTPEELAYLSGNGQT